MPDHLAVLRPEYLELVLRGNKTIECRLTRTAKVPFGVVRQGERIHLKASSGPVLGTARAGRVIFKEIRDGADLAQIRRRYGKRICAADDFWQSADRARYCSLIFLEDVRAIRKSFRIRKRDMRAWVVLDGGQGFDWPGVSDEA